MDLRVEEYLRFRAALRLAGRAARREEVDRVLDLCDLEPARRRICGQLSRGYRQRLSLADALLGAPPILVLDEPTVGLDPNQLAQVRRLIGALSGKHTVLLSSHLLGEVEAVCSKVIILNQGWVVAQGALADLSAEAGGGGLVVRVGGADKASLAEALISVEGIEAVEEAGAGEGTLRLRCMVTDAVRGAVAARVVARGWDLLELTDASPDLEQVFAGLTREDQ